MSPVRARAAVPNALSFSRATMRELLRGRYRIEKLRFELDREGRGEVLYRLVGGGWVFHFFLVSDKLPEAQKTDRNFAPSWDAMGVLCQGDWTAEREARLRREVPKQRAGLADYDTLIYARGNRSARLFDHVVESLAAGRQPDPKLLAPVGYILRTTAFIGNGQLGTRPFAGYGADHPLRRPYHAQFCSAFMLREYVFDLVDHLARERNPNAARLSYAYRRYLGLGNAAATGLVSFVVNHPHLMHQWSLACETALASAKRRPPTTGDAAAFARLLDKAIRHFTESERESDGVFATPQEVASDLRRVRDACAAGGAAPAWTALHEWAERHVGPEAVEILDAIVLELHPDIVEAAVDDFQIDECFEVDPGMTVAELRRVVQQDYAWALEPQFRGEAAQHFWYRSTKAPRDVRRGLRGRDRRFEAETSMDTVLQVQRLWDCLEAAAGDAPAADIVCARPDLRHIVARVQSLAGLPYAELREDWLAGRFSPFGPVRFALAFYGLEKFEAALPKSVRGTFMQGAPIAEDVAVGADGDWPFPLMPSSALADPRPLAPLPISTPAASGRPTPPPDTELRIAPYELARMVQTALQGHGAPLGVAEEAARLLMFAQACGEPAVAALLRQCANGSVARGVQLEITQRWASYAALDGHDSPAVLAAPAAFDLAAVAALTQRAGVTVVTRVEDPWVVGELALRAAARGLIGLATWSDAASACEVAAAGPGTSGTWYVRAALPAAPAWHAAHSKAAAAADAIAALLALVDSRRLASAFAAPPMQPRSGAVFAIACVQPSSIDAADAVFGFLARLPQRAAAWKEDAVRARQNAWHHEGIVLSRAEFDALGVAGAALLVPDSDESRVLSEGADPLKVF